jgi:diguanylate cyclase (GGDEF)-like protein
LNSTYRTLVSLAIPAAVLLAAYFAVARISDLPASLAGLRVYGAYVLLVLGMLVSLVFRRGRVLFALLSLAIAYVCYRVTVQFGLANFAARTLLAALCVFVPFNLGLLSLLQERGTFNRHGLRRSAVILLQIGVTAWVLLFRKTGVTDWAYTPFLETAWFAASPIPQLGLAVMATCVAAAMVRWSLTGSAIDLGLAAAVVVFAIGANRIAVSDVFAVFTAAGGLILTIAVLQDAFRMAFRDELTGLPSRRDLNEQLAGLGRHFTIAMLDVDHFKNLNDTYGHELGDQVLKMVAAKVARVGGGGKAYRYGGEEFTVLFPGKSISEAMPYLDALRRNIESYEMALRSGDRLAQPKPGKRPRARRRGGRAVSVTISIGVSERNERLAAPDDVIQAADKALYRAKNKGRNQVSR